MKSCLVILTIAIGFFIFGPSLVHAQVIISEVMANPETGPEWVEIFNLGPTLANLSGYYLEDQLSSPSVIHTFASTESLNAYQVLVVELSSQKLNNSGDGVTLKDATNQVVDQVSFGSSSMNSTWHRQIQLNLPLVTGVPDPGQVAWLTPTPTVSPAIQPTPLPPDPTSIAAPTPTQTPTPQAAPTSTSTPTHAPTNIPTSNPTLTNTISPTPTFALSLASQIHINEIVACADDHGEWVELYNASDLSVNLTGWTFKDDTGNVKYLSGSISSQSLLVFSWGSGLLNNSGDKLKLITPSNQTLEEVTIPACHNDSSYALVNNTWQMTDSPTYGLPNVIPLSPAPSITPTTQVKSRPQTQVTDMPSVMVPTKPTNQTANLAPANSLKTNNPMLNSLSASNLTLPYPNSDNNNQISHSSDSASLNVSPDPISYEWLSVIMSGLLLSTGGLFLTHVPIPIQLVNFLGG